MKILTAEETKDFLTKSDLVQIESGISDCSLLSEMIDGFPVFIHRKKAIRLFVVLELIGVQ